LKTSSNKVIKLFDKFVSSLSFIGAVWIVLMMLLIVADVIGRSVFNQPVTGTSEIIRNSIVGITFLQMTHVLKNGRHIRTTLLLDKVSQKWKMVMNGFAYLIGLVLFILLVSQSWEPMLEAYRTGDYEGEGALKVPTWPARFLVLLGSLVMALQFAILLYGSIRNLFIGSNKDIKDDISV
jgi:TRAP-type C4-dicarboxylate transport system permease small subunit